MKTKSRIPVLIFALPLLSAAIAGAAPDQKPVTIEKRVEVRAPEGGGVPHAIPLPPPAPVTFLGLEVAPVDETLAAQLKLPAEHGLIVRLVVPDSPAAQAGLMRNDVLVKLDDQLLIAPRQLSALVRSHKEGETIKLSYIRAGSEARATATLIKRVPPHPPMPHGFQWTGEDAMPSMPAQRQFKWRFENGAPGATIEEDRVIIAPPGAGGPHVMIFRPKSRIVYQEDDVTLEVTTDEKGRQLEARGADGTILYSGPITTPEQRAAVPANLQKHLEKLDALEPSEFDVPVPGHAPTARWESTAPGEVVPIQATVEVDAPEHQGIAPHATI